MPPHLSPAGFSVARSRYKPLLVGHGLKREGETSNEIFSCGVSDGGTSSGYVTGESGGFD